LGIKSPSRLFAGYGENVIQGLARGLNKTTSVDRALRSLSRTVDAQFAPTMTLGARRVTSSSRPRIAPAPSTAIAYLSPEDREIMRHNNVSVRIGDRDIAQAQASANFRSTRTGV